MANVKKTNHLKSLRPNLLTIRHSNRFGQIIKKLLKGKKVEFVWVEKPKPAQMSAILLSRLLGKKFVWVQEFTNPPKANFVTRFILTQCDQIMVKNRKDAMKLKSFGVKSGRVHLEK